MWTLILSIMVSAPDAMAASSSTMTTVPGFADDTICLQSGEVWARQIKNQPHNELQRITPVVTCVYTPFPIGVPFATDRPKVQRP